MIDCTSNSFALNRILCIVQANLEMLGTRVLLVFQTFLGIIVLTLISFVAALDHKF